MKKRKFLIVAGFGASLIDFRGQLIADLQAKGFEVHAAAPGLTADSAVTRKLQERGVLGHDIKMRRTGMNPVADFLALLDLWKLMRSVRPEFSFSYTIKPVIYGSLAARIAGVPFNFAMLTGLGYAFQGEDKRGILKRLVQALCKIALVGVDKVFFQNPDDERLFRKLDIISPKSLSCVINGSGVDVEEFFVADIPAGAPRFLLIARYLGDKGIREYAEAARRVRRVYPGTSFSIVGWIDENPDAIHEAELRRWVEDGVLHDMGRLSDVRGAISNCSVYVLPSYREGTPRTVLEAMAMGRPIITTDAPGCRETIKDGVSGILVAVKSVDELEQAMLQFVLRPDLINSMGAAARARVEEKYDVRKVNKMMLDEMGVE